MHIRLGAYTPPNLRKVHIRLPGLYAYMHININTVSSAPLVSGRFSFFLAGDSIKQLWSIQNVPGECQWVYRPVVAQPVYSSHSDEQTP